MPSRQYWMEMNYLGTRSTTCTWLGNINCMQRLGTIMNIKNGCLSSRLFEVSHCAGRRLQYWKTSTNKWFLVLPNLWLALLRFLPTILSLVPLTCSGWDLTVSSSTVSYTANQTVLIWIVRLGGKEVKMVVQSWSCQVTGQNLGSVRTTSIRSKSWDTQWTG